MEDQVVSVGFGKENFQSTGVSLGAFHLASPWRRELPSKVLKRQGAMQVFPASVYPEINGKLFIDTVRAPEGTMLLLMSSHKRIIREGRPPMLHDGALVLRTRATGPMLTVHASLPTSQEALLTGKFLAFQGRADVLTQHDMEEFGLQVPSNFVETYFDADEVADCFEVSIISPGISEKPRLESIKVGDEVVVVPARATRRVKRRR